MILTTTSTVFVAANPVCCNYEQEECCNSPCPKQSSIDWKLYGGAVLGAAVVGGVVGAVSVKGKKGHKGCSGRTGPLPIFNVDPDPSQTIEFL